MSQSFVMALRSIGSSKMRSVLTMLGIIIGVMALVVLVSLVNGATNSVTDAVAQLGRMQKKTKCARGSLPSGMKSTITENSTTFRCQHC